MKNFTVGKLRRTLLLLTAVAAVGLSGCGDGGGNPSGGDDNGDDGGGLVGDWMLYSASYDGKITYNEDDPRGIALLTLKSSGEGSDEWLFRKVGNVWVEIPFEDRHEKFNYRVVGQTIYTTRIDVEESREYNAGTYIISGNKLILSQHRTDDYDNTDHYKEATYTRVNVAAIRNSLDGPVYINDSRLYKSAAYDKLSWYSQDNENDYIKFSPYPHVSGNGLDRYFSSDDVHDVGYYTTGNKLFLVNESCDWDDGYVEHCSVSGTVELTYKITGSGRNMQLSINGDIWLPAEGRDYDYSPSPSRQTKRKTVYNSGKSIFSPPSSRVFGGSRQ